jgi:hypothetical protein
MAKMPITTQGKLAKQARRQNKGQDSKTDKNYLLPNQVRACLQLTTQNVTNLG